MQIRNKASFIKKALFAVTIIGCKLGSQDAESDAASSASAAAPTAPAANEVIRYTGMETAETGELTVRATVRARKAADQVSDIVDTIPAGTNVTKIARYGTLTLVSWDGGTKQGWIDARVAGGAVTVSPASSATAQFPTLDPAATASASASAAPSAAPSATPPRINFTARPATKKPASPKKPEK